MLDFHRGLLQSATNPENGTVTYTYNADSTLFYKLDAKGQATVYYYDSLRRVIQISRWPNGLGNGRGQAEDTCARVTFSYDTNPVNPSFSQNSAGRLTAAQYFMPSLGNQNNYNGCYAGSGDSYTEMYSYHPAGGVTAKNFSLLRQGIGANGSASLEVDYTFDTAGRTATVTYPMTFPNFQGNQPVLTYAYDTMGRASTLNDTAGDFTLAPTTWATASYDYAGRLGGLGYRTGPTAYYPYPYAVAQWASTGWGYNASGQMSGITWYSGNSTGGVQYVYSATQNNGQITQAIDTLSGETIGYQYDSLKRLISASSTPNAGSSTAPWTQTFQYDGFGNMTGKTLNGTLTAIAVNPANNQLVVGSYDANGNAGSGSGLPPSYDEANRLGSVYGATFGTGRYGYDPGNKRVYRETSSLQEEFTFYGARGEKLGVFGVEAYGGTCTQQACGIAFTPQATSIWFAGHLIMDTNNGVLQDRVGTNRAQGTAAFNAPFARFYPYGDEITSTSNDRVKFGTYTRDSDTGLDYADQRYLIPGYGTFMTPDPYMAKARGANDPATPGSWNRYAYVLDDPINGYDPSGLNVVDAEDPEGIGPDQGEDGVGEGWDYWGVPFVQPLGPYSIQTFAGPANITVAGYSRSGARETTISNDLTIIQNQVLTGNCAKWLTNQDYSASDLIGAMMTAVAGGPSFGYGVLNSYTTAAFVGTTNTNGTPVPGLPANASITVNSAGAFFNGAYAVGSGSTQYSGGTLQAQIFILVHELAHLVGAAGFLPDAGNAPNGVSNDKLVQQNCGQQIAGVH